MTNADTKLRTVSVWTAIVKPGNNTPGFLYKNHQDWGAILLVV